MTRAETKAKEAIEIAEEGKKEMKAVMDTLNSRINALEAKVAKLNNIIVNAQKAAAQKAEME